jgi:hypothetical protein
MHLSSFLNKEIVFPLDDERFYDELMKRVACSKKKDVEPVEFADAADVMKSTKS